MDITLDPSHRRYLSQKVRSGKFKSASEVVKHALNRLKRDEQDLAWLKREIKKGVDSLDNGEATDWDVEEEKARLLRRFRRRRSPS